MKKGKIIVVGFGPGSETDMTPAVIAAIRECDVVVGYKLYFKYIQHCLPEGTECVDTGMKREKDRARQAFELAEGGKNVCVVSSGDACIYGMAPLILEMKRERGSDVDVEVVPGISAFQKAASLLGAPVSHDFCVISLSDLMTPWEKIECRIRAAADADFVTAVYNPKSTERYWQLHRLKEVMLKRRDGFTPVGYVRQAGRDGETVVVTTLKDFNPEAVDMFTIVIIGNSQSYLWKGKMITPRGYYSLSSEENCGVGQNIMIQSFKTIEAELKNKELPIDHKWALLHAIHTTADFDMEDVLYVDNEALRLIYENIASGDVHTIVTDVTMAASGIRKGALKRLDVEVKCYLNDERVENMSRENGITRTQAGIRLAAEEHPDALYVFGNAPTALMELCSLIRKGKARPCGVVAAPVGFVHVCESKHMLKSFVNIPKIMVEGRKGGSNLAATLVNSILCYDDAVKLKPGRDV